MAIKEKGLTDHEIGSRVGVSQSVITRLRNGIHKSTSYERGLAINELARVECPDLFSNELAASSKGRAPGS